MGIPGERERRQSADREVGRVKTPRCGLHKSRDLGPRYPTAGRRFASSTAEEHGPAIFRRDSPFNFKDHKSVTGLPLHTLARCASLASFYVSAHAVFLFLFLQPLVCDTSKV